MVGRLKKDADSRKGKLLVEGVGLVARLRRSSTRSIANTISDEKEQGLIPTGDHYPFTKRKVPIVFLWTGCTRTTICPPIRPTNRRRRHAADRRSVRGRDSAAGQHFDRPEYGRPSSQDGRRPTGAFPKLEFAPGVLPRKWTGRSGRQCHGGGARRQGWLEEGRLIVLMAGQQIRQHERLHAHHYPAAAPPTAGDRRAPRWQEVNLKIIPQ